MYQLIYILLECIIEAWWEWTAFSVIVAVQELHWMGGIIVFSMLFAHVSMLLLVINVSYESNAHMLTIQFLFSGVILVEDCLPFFLLKK